MTETRNLEAAGCCRCGGSLGQPETEIDPTADPRAWHACYHCLNTGTCACEVAR